MSSKLLASGLGRAARDPLPVLQPSIAAERGGPKSHRGSAGR